MGHKHTKTLAHLHQLSTPHLFSLSHNSSYPLHSTKHICNNTLPYRAHTALHQLSARCHTSPTASFSSHCSSFPSFTAQPASVAPKPIRFSFLPVFIYMQLSSKTNSRPCTADSISVSPSTSHYTPHELWIGASLRRGSGRNDKWQSLGASQMIDNSECTSSFSSLSVLALWQ